MGLFEKASRMGLRFETKKGLISTEDLWDLPLLSRSGVSLDDLAKSLNRAVKINEEESFVVKKSNKNTTLELKFDIVKHIIEIKIAEKEKKENEVEVKAKKEKIMGILASKEYKRLLDLPEEELKAML